MASRVKLHVITSNPLLPMQSKKIKLDALDKTNIEFPVIVQKSYDGKKCLVSVTESSNVFFTSTTGKPVQLDSFTTSFEYLFTRFSDVFTNIEGYVYMHNASTKELKTAIDASNVGVENTNLKFVITDINIADTKFENRMNILELVEDYAMRENISNILFDCGTIVNNKEGIVKQYMESLKYGYEGVAITNVKLHYALGASSKHKLLLQPNYQD